MSQISHKRRMRRRRRRGGEEGRIIIEIEISKENVNHLIEKHGEEIDEQQANNQVGLTSTLGEHKFS